MVAMMLLLIVLAVEVTAGRQNRATKIIPDLPNQLTSVTYKVTGSARSASLTYKNATGGTEQANVDLPWTLRFDAESGSSVYLSAQKRDEFGKLEAKIYIDGDLLQKADSSSPYAIASVSGVARSSEISFNQMTSAQHLERFWSALESDLPREAARHLDSISQSAPDAPQNRKLKDMVLAKAKGERDEWSRNADLQTMEDSLKKRDRNATASAIGQQMVLSANFLKDAHEQREKLDVIRKSGMGAALCQYGLREVRFTGTALADATGDLILPLSGQNYSLECK